MAGRTRPLSTGGKAGVLGRVAVQQLGGSRLGRAAWSAATATFSSLTRTARILFLQITGLFFVAFAVIGGFAIAGEYQDYAAGRVGPGRGLLVLGFVLLFAWFGVSSFWRAGRK
ncbi:MAG: hypothetical protein AB7O65_00540 [Candidatus Korobacteraceae bacterium]